MITTKEKYFAGFVITFERPLILRDTIDKIFRQTIPPEKLLVVDNSTNDETKKLILALNDERLQYYHVGYNSGASGGAYYGLKLLGEEGYDYIQWFDDDDPPAIDNCNERMLACLRDSTDVGIVGITGAKLNKWTGNITRLKNDELRDVPVMVDYIGGNQAMIVKGDLVRNGCLPAKDLFFGFEDLSFCLSVLKHGHRILINGDLAMENRRRSNRIEVDKNSLKNDFSGTKTWRAYYSYRALIYIYLWENKLYTAALFQALKGIAKSIRYPRTALNICKGITDAIVKRLGMRVMPGRKYESS